MSGPEDDPADDVQPTREEWEAWEAARQAERDRRRADEDLDPFEDQYDLGGEG